MVKAYHKYLDILAHDQNNCFACLGVANVLAFFNKNEDAKEIYKLVSQANPNIYHAYMNQAHLSIGEKNYELAINLYQSILSRFLPNDLKTEMYLAKAHFMKGEFDISKNKILKLIAHYPHYIPLKFNLALCLYH